MRRAIIVLSVLLVTLIFLVPAVVPALYPFIDPVNGLAGAALAPDIYSGRFIVEGISGEARVFYDDMLVPHIEATSDEAGFYAVGWVSASLRLFQMDLYRRVALGNLSSLIGSAGLESDRLALTLGLPSAIEESWRILKGNNEFSDVVSAIEAYTRGVNDYIEYARDNRLLPAEYRVLGLEPEPWEPIHSLSIAKLLSLMLAWDTDDLVLNELVRRHGLDIIVNLDILNRTRNVAHAPCSESIRVGQVLGGSTLDPGELPPSAEVASRFSTPFGGWSDASNNWVVSPRVSASGKPLLANDPHLRLTAPPIWLILHLKTPNFNVAGVTVPGVPFVVIGRNLDVAWGFTNVGSDFADFYYYTWSGDRYLYMGEWMEPVVREYEVKVWDPKARTYETEIIRVRSTVHGPLLESGGEAFAVKFTGSYPSLEVVFIYLLNRAEIVKDVIEAQRYFVSPIQNLVVADSGGNIAYSPNGGYPIRTNIPTIQVGSEALVNFGFLPFNGSRGEGEWVGFTPFNELPLLYNPDLPYVATANSKPWNGSCGQGLGWNYADRFRTMRIYELLEQYSSVGPLTPGDMASIQLDSRDYSMEAIARILLDITPRTRETGPYLEMLEAWLGNPETGPQSMDASLALAWTYTFHEAVWERLYGSNDNRYFFKIEHLEALYEGYLEGEEWASRYLGGASLGDLATSSLNRAIEILNAFFGGDDWLYGDLHWYRIQGFVITLDIAGDPAPGGPYSVNVAPPSTLDPGEGAPVSVGPSVRLVSDLSDSILRIALPGGQSGNPFSPHYSNHYRKYWLPGEYYEIDLAVVDGREGPVFVGGASGG